MICPKCKYERVSEDDVVTPSYECPSCGVIYSKYKLKTKKTVSNTSSEENKNMGISIILGFILFLIIFQFIYGDGLKYFAIFDKKPTASFYEITKMSKSEMRSYRSDQCSWAKREMRRNPGFFLEATVKKCKKDGY